MTQYKGLLHHAATTLTWQLCRLSSEGTVMHGCKCTLLEPDQYDLGHIEYQSQVRVDTYWKASMSGSSRYPMVGCRDKQDMRGRCMTDKLVASAAVSNRCADDYAAAMPMQIIQQQAKMIMHNTHVMQHKHQPGALHHSCSRTILFLQTHDIKPAL